LSRLGSYFRVNRYCYYLPNVLLAHPVLISSEQSSRPDIRRSWIICTTHQLTPNGRRAGRAVSGRRLIGDDRDTYFMVDPLVHACSISPLHPVRFLLCHQCSASRMPSMVCAELLATLNFQLYFRQCKLPKARARGLERVSNSRICEYLRQRMRRSASYWFQ